MIGVLALWLSGAALAGDPPSSIQLTGLPPFDRVYKDLRAADDRIGDAEKVWKQSKRRLAASMGLKAGTSLKVAVDRLSEQCGGRARRSPEGFLVPSDDLAPAALSGVVVLNEIIEDFHTQLREVEALEVAPLAQKSGDFKERRGDVKRKHKGKARPKLKRRIKDNAERIEQLRPRKRAVIDKMVRVLEHVEAGFPARPPGG